MKDDFVKGPGDMTEPPKKRKRIMKEFVINEISGVDFGAQEGARVVLMKRAERPLEKLVVLTSSEVGHQHAVDIDEWTLRRAGGCTSEGYSEGSEEDHEHPFSIDPSGNVTIGDSQGHTHTVDIASLLQRLQLNSVVREQNSVVNMRSPLVKSESGKNFGVRDFALVPQPEQPSTWRLRLAGTPGGNPDRRLVGNAVEALKRHQVPENERADVIRRVRAAWLQAHKSMTHTDLPSVLKQVSSL